MLFNNYIKMKVQAGNEKVIKGQRLFALEDSQQLASKPHCSIGALSFLEDTKISQIEGYSSAVLISPNLLLTTAHSCISVDYGTQNQNILFYPSKAGAISNKQVDPIRCVGFQVTEYYKKNAHRKQLKDDFALIRLERRIEEVQPYSKCMRITPCCPYCMIDMDKQEVLDIYGYPFSPLESQNYKLKDKKGKTFILRQEGKTSDKGQKRIQQYDPKNGKITYAMTTFPGQSGCPVVYGDKMIAIHAKAGDPNQNFNVGRLLTPEVINHLVGWTKKMGADPFQIDTTNLCHHLKQIFNIKYVSSDALEVKNLVFSKEQDQKGANFFQKLSQPNSKTSSLPQIPKEYRFDAESLNYPQLGLPPKTNSVWLRYISKLRREYQVERSTVFTSAQKEQMKKQLQQEYYNTISNEWRIAAKFQDATTLGSRWTRLIEFSEHTLLPKLTTLDLQRNQLLAIDLSHNKSLNFLNLAYNRLTSINLSPLANLTVLWLADNKIRQINLASNEHLAYISLQYNGLESLQLPSRGSIAVLWVNDNRLKEFRFFYDPAIFSSHDFGYNPQGCLITIAYDKKNSKKAQQFLEELKSYNGYGSEYYKSYVFRLQEV